MARVIFFTALSTFLITALYFSGKDSTKGKRIKKEDLRKRLHELEKRVDNLDTILKNRKYKEAGLWQ